MPGSAPDVSRRFYDRVSSGLGDRYELQRVLGGGGMSAVFLARDLKHSRMVAIKVLRPELAEGIGGERFLQEIGIEASLDHANIVPLFDSGEAEGLPFYVMPYVAGESLEARLRREPQLPLDEAVRITTEVAAALSAAHSQGILHRDIKPANILLGKNRAKVSDFGVARALDEAGATRITRTGVAVGTPAYMSPEQGLSEGPLDHRSDQYSLACVLHEMLAGEPLFAARSARIMIYNHAAREPPRIRKLRPEVPRALERVLFTALSKSPSDRFPSIEAFSAALQAAVSTERGGAAVRAGSLVGTGAVSRSSRVWFVDRLEVALLDHPLRVAASVLGFGGLVIVGSVLLARQFTLPGPPQWDGGRPQSVAVLPSLPGELSTEEEALATEVADRLALELNGWEPMRAVGAGELRGLMLDLGHQEAAFESVGAAIEVARAADVQALAGLSLQIRGDSVFAQVSLYESTRGRLVRRIPPVQAAVGQTETLLAGLVFGVLDLDPGTTGTVTLRSGTTSPEALAANWRGRAALYRADLEEAEGHFRAAVAHDSAFSPALNNLALTLYWRATVRGRGREPLYDEARRWSTLAMGSLAGLTGEDAEHIRAFYAFQNGDFPAARDSYRRLVDASPTDLLAWLMLGTVERSDRWLAEDSPDGAPRPRSDLELSFRAIEKTLELQPTFELGYLQYSQMTDRLRRSIRLRACPVFYPWTGEPVAPWRDREPSAEGVPFCPMATGGLRWVPAAEFRNLPESELLPGSARLFNHWIELLERWATFAPNSPRPLDQLAEAYLSERAGRSVISPQRSRALAERALEHTREAVSRKPEPAHEDLIRIANLHLALDEPAEALRLARAALDFYRNGEEERTTALPPPLHYANAFIATGEVETALELVESRSPRYLRHPDGGSLISLAGAERIVSRIRSMTAMGITGAPIHREFEAIEEEWNREGYGEREREALKEFLSRELITSLALDPDLRARFSGDLETDHPLWTLIRSPPSEGDELARSLEEVYAGRDLTIKDADWPFAMGVLAGQWGQHELGLRYLSRLDSIPFGVDEWDSGWGLRAVSYRLRAEQLRALGQLEEAREWEALFANSRGEALAPAQ